MSARQRTTRAIVSLALCCGGWHQAEAARSEKLSPQSAVPLLITIDPGARLSTMRLVLGLSAARSENPVMRQVSAEVTALLDGCAALQSAAFEQIGGRLRFRPEPGVGYIVAAADSLSEHLPKLFSLVSGVLMCSVDQLQSGERPQPTSPGTAAPAARERGVQFIERVLYGEPAVLQPNARQALAESWLSPAEAVVAVVDRRSTEHVTKAWRVAFAPWESASPLPLSDVHPRIQSLAPGVVHVVNTSAPGRALILLGARAPHGRDPRFSDWEVLNRLLGGSPSSLLFRSVRTDTGLAYSVFSTQSRALFPSLWIAAAETQTSSAERALALMLQSLERGVKGDFSDDDVDVALNGYQGSRALSLDLSDAELQRRTREWLFGLQPDPLRTGLKGRLQAMAQERLRINQTAIVVVGDACEIQSNFISLTLRLVIHQDKPCPN